MKPTIAHYMVTKDQIATHTVNRERFAGPNFHGFEEDRKSFP